jgi:hypothetical protein
MALTKVSRGLLSTSIVDNGNATAITIDASENVGIGTSSPTYKFNVLASSGSQNIFQAGQSGVSNGLSITSNGSALTYSFLTGNVGIGTSSPSFAVGGGLQVQADSFSSVRVTETGNTGLDVSQASDAKGYVYLRDNADLIFGTNNTERMRIDSSGNLLVGKSSSAINTDGVELLNSGRMFLTTTSLAHVIRRKSTDGALVEFQKDGSTVGSIGSRGGTDSYILLGGAGLTGSATSTGALLPTKTANSFDDDVVDLGFSGARFDDIYATNGTIQTSDRNEKQDIEALSDAEQRVAVAAKGLLRKFRWKSAVAEKGDEARIHFGIIAQDLQDAFTAEGLDAGRYAMFINSTWTDEETGEERTRMGVRYSELLAFIIAAS